CSPPGFADAAPRIGATHWAGVGPGDGRLHCAVIVDRPDGDRDQHAPSLAICPLGAVSRAFAHEAGADGAAAYSWAFPERFALRLFPGCRTVSRFFWTVASVVRSLPWFGSR